MQVKLFLTTTRRHADENPNNYIPEILKVSILRPVFTAVELLVYSNQIPLFSEKWNFGAEILDCRI